jgi:two-component system response regulator DegU
LAVSVLVADEDPNIRRCLKQALECECRFSVQWEADNGLQALAMIQQHRPNIVLINSQLQRMGGIEATRCVKHRNADVKIVVMSIYEADREPAMQAGADAFITKDSGCEAFRSTMQTLLLCEAK